MDQTIAPYITNNSKWVFYCKLKAFMNHSIKLEKKSMRPTFIEANKKYKNMFTNSQCFLNS